MRHDKFCEELMKITGLSIQYTSAAYYTCRDGNGTPEQLAQSYKARWNL